MSVLASYIAVVLIWSTTPLAIKLSNSGLSPHAAILLRMLIAFFLAAAFIAVWQHNSLLKRKNLRVYIASAIAIFPNMSLVYISANYIPSALIAVMFALTPMTTGILASVVLGERFFTARRLLALLCAFIGLAVIFSEQLYIHAKSYIGIALMMLSNVVFSISQVWVKKLQQTYSVTAFEQTFGAISLAIPGLLLSWLVFDGAIPSTFEYTALCAVVYLGVIGSLLGFVAYFIVLSHLSVSLVALIPLITPGLALWLGALVLSEPLSFQLCFGTACIVFALVIYDGFLDGLKRR